MIQVFPDCLQFRGRLVHHYALLDRDRIILIDGGFLSNTPSRVEEQLSHAGRSIEEVSHILLTHGHFDHTRNIAELRKRTGAAVWAPKLDEDLIAGEFKYVGSARACGAVEWIGRRLLGFEPPIVDRWLEPEEKTELWGDLECVPLPGHTQGHTGYYSPSRELLFAADLFSNYFGHQKLPPRWLNSDQRAVIESIRSASCLSLEGGVLLSHCHSGTPEDHRSNLQFLALKHGI